MVEAKVHGYLTLADKTGTSFKFWVMTYGRNRTPRVIEEASGCYIEPNEYIDCQEAIQIMRDQVSKADIAALASRGLENFKDDQYFPPRPIA